MANLNVLQWDGSAGHYEVYYVSLTDRASGVGVWVRLTMLAPLSGAATCSLWFMAMDPVRRETIGRKADLPIEALTSEIDPFAVHAGDAVVTDTAMRGQIDDVSWDLTWAPGRPYEHVDRRIQRLGVAQTILTLPHADVVVAGTVTIQGRPLELDGARGGQAHLWGRKHAARWAWVHCNDFSTPEGEARPDTFVDGVSVYVPRFGRGWGPATPVVGRFDGRDFSATAPLSVARASSRFDETSWRFAATDGDRRLVGEVDALRDHLVGVTYHDPDGDPAYCYNSEVAWMRLQVWERARRRSAWTLRDTLVADGRAHFEYAQREPLEGLTLHVT